MSETGTQLVKFGALALLIQNAILVLGSFTVPSLLEYVLYIDLLGFTLLGVGYILHTQQGGGEQQFLIGGAAVIVWVLARVTWQFILTGDIGFGNASLDNIDSFYTTINNMIYAFLFSGIALLVAGYMINKVANNGGTLFFAYGLINFICVFLIVQPFISQSAENIEGQVTGVLVGVFVKMIVVPILGAILFAKVFSNTESHLGMEAAA